MNVYLLEDNGGVTVFDCGISDMTSAVRTAGVRLGVINRVVLGHADADHGLLGLFRESDRLALVSDCFYALDPQTGIKGAARVPHPAFNIDTEQVRASIRKLAALSPSVAWAGHADPVRGDVVAQLERASSAI